jgi:hypothetical protein
MVPVACAVLVLAGMSLGEQALAQARIYRWTDAEGQTLSPKYLSTRIESAAAEQWNAECLFKTYTLRQIEFRFTNPDAGTTQKIRALLTRLMQEARRLTGPHSS